MSRTAGGVRSWIAEVVRGDRSGAVAGIVRAGLRPLSYIYGGAVRLRGSLYQTGRLRRTRLSVPVVSVGNLTVGGTGKTPMVAHLAARLRALGRRPGVASRGYGGRDGRNEEAAVLEASVPDLPHVQHPDRARAAEALLEKGVDVVLLDDAFQHLALERNLDLVLVDATRPLRKDRLLPAGSLREPLAALARADLVALTRADLVPPGAREALWEEIGRHRRSTPRIETAHEPVAVLEGGTDARRPAETLRGREVVLLSGLGNPRGFEESVRRLGAVVRDHLRFPDHHAYGAKDIDRARRAAGPRPLVTTLKDFVKFGPEDRERFLVLLVEIRFSTGEEILQRALEGALFSGRDRPIDGTTPNS